MIPPPLHDEPDLPAVPLGDGPALVRADAEANRLESFGSAHAGPMT